MPGSWATRAPAELSWVWLTPKLAFNSTMKLDKEIVGNKLFSSVSNVAISSP